MADHVRILSEPHPQATPGAYTMWCQVCDTKVVVHLPLPVSEFSAIGMDFSRRHRDCGYSDDTIAEVQRRQVAAGLPPFSGAVVQEARRRSYERQAQRGAS